MADYYVSPAGDDAHPGTRARPLATFEPLSSPEGRLSAGDTVYVRGGTIRSRGVALRDVWGRPDAPVSIVADGDATPVLDCSGGDGHGLELDGCGGVAIRGIAVRGAARDGVRIGGQDSGRVTIEGVDVHGHGRSGAGDAIHATGDADLLVRGCCLRESHRNAGRGSGGLAIEGLSGRCHVLASEFYRNAGGGAVVTGGDPGRIRLRRCVAHRNGFDADGRTGFGPGGRARGGVPGFRVDDAGVLDRCVAYYNAGPGFLCGAASAIVHATAWANAGAGYRWPDGDGEPANCLAAANVAGPVAGIDREAVGRDGGAAGGDGEMAGVVAPRDPGFRSTDETDPAFLKPRADSPIVGAGCDSDCSDGRVASVPGARRAAPVSGAPGRDSRSGKWIARSSTVLRDWRFRLDWRVDRSPERPAGRY